MNDNQIYEHIENCLAEEHRLLEHGDGGGMTSDDRDRLEAISVRLDQYWDLLRQRRARRDAGQDRPSRTCARRTSSNTISSRPAACHPERRRGVSTPSGGAACHPERRAGVSS